MKQEEQAAVEAPVDADTGLAEDAGQANGSRKPDEEAAEKHASEAEPVAASAPQHGVSDAKELDGAREQHPEQPATSMPDSRGDDSKASVTETLATRRFTRGTLQSKTSQEAPSTSKAVKPGRGSERGARGSGASQEHQEQGTAEKAKRGKRGRQDGSGESDHEGSKDGDAEREPEKRSRSGAGGGRGQGAKGRARGALAAAAATTEGEGEAEQTPGQLPLQAPGPSRRKGKRHAQKAPSGGSPEGQRQQQQPPDASKLVPDPKSSQYQALDRAGKLSAFQAASDAFVAALKAADEAHKVVEGHAEAWHSEPIDVGNHEVFTNLVSVFRNAHTSHQQHLDSLRTPVMSELMRLWKYMFRNQAEFSPGATAQQAKAKAPPAQGQGQAAGRPQQGAARAGGASNANGQADAKQGLAPAMVGKVVKLEAALQKAGVQPSKEGARLAASPAHAAKQPPAAQQGLQPGSSPAPSTPVVHLVSVQSTGNSSRDRTVAALFQALSSAGAVDTAEVAVELERRVFEKQQQQDGSVGPAYMRRAFLLWSVLAPDSEAFCSEVHDAVLQGVLQPEELAGMDLGEQTPAQPQG